MIMFSWLYKYYSESRSIMTSLGDKGGGGQGSFVSFSEEKETQDHVSPFSFALSASSFPSLPPTSPSPPALPSRIRIPSQSCLPDLQYRKSEIRNSVSLTPSIEWEICYACNSH